MDCGMVETADKVNTMGEHELRQHQNYSAVRIPYIDGRRGTPQLDEHRNGQAPQEQSVVGHGRYVNFRSSSTGFNSIASRL
mmetsp:Transcript_2497/g.6962  ORF Transcript_2497/g.6962 Transcript_2497/m.6962 type:complete len:81 (+) Transcript_2497:87-329(+)